MVAGAPGAPSLPAVVPVEEGTRQEQESVIILHLQTEEPSVLEQHPKLKTATRKNVSTVASLWRMEKQRVIFSSPPPPRTPPSRCGAPRAAPSESWQLAVEEVSSRDVKWIQRNFTVPRE